MQEQEQVSAPVEAVDAPVTDVEDNETPESADGQAEQAAETDEQRNERVLREREERSRKRMNSVQHRINELTADKRRLEELVSKLAERPTDSPKSTPEVADAGMPPREKYDSWEAWQDAKAEWIADRKAEQKLQGFIRQVQQQQVMRQAQEQAAVLAEKFDKDVSKVRSEFEDYDDVVGNLDFNAPPSMVQAILESDSPARIFHALGKNPQEARRIAAMQPISQAKAIARIEAALTSQPQVSRAPPPGKPVGVRGGPVEKAPSEMNVDEFFKWRRKQIAARRG